MEHKLIPPENRHAPHSWVVADAAARAALVVTEADLGKYCWQKNDNSEWMLIGHAPAVWKTLDLPVSLKDLTITGSLKETAAVIGGTGIIDLSAANLFSHTVTAAITLAPSNAAAAGKVNSFILEIKNGGAAAVTWWAGIKWPGGEAPELTASGVDVFGFYTRDGGVTWRCVGMGAAV